MQVQSSSSTPIANSGASSAGNDTSAQIAALQKQLRVVTQEIKVTIADTSMEAKAKQQKIKLLNAQAMAIQTQIAALQRAQQQAQQDNALQAQVSADKTQHSSNKRPEGAKGWLADETA
jgi:hypothetical protein